MSLTKYSWINFSKTVVHLSNVFSRSLKNRVKKQTEQKKCWFSLQKSGWRRFFLKKKRTQKRTRPTRLIVGGSGCGPIPARFIFISFFHWLLSLGVYAIYTVDWWMFFFSEFFAASLPFSTTTTTTTTRGSTVALPERGRRSMVSDIDNDNNDGGGVVASDRPIIIERASVIHSLSLSLSLARSVCVCLC